LGFLICPSPSPARRNPESGKARQELAAALVTSGSQLLAKGSTGEAIDLFAEAIWLVPGYTGGYLGLAQAFLFQGNTYRRPSIQQNGHPGWTLPAETF
jgi:Tfp pilus assembly protein PilF